jgi:hypothetical protein
MPSRRSDRIARLCDVVVLSMNASADGDQMIGRAAWLNGWMVVLRGKRRASME